MPTKTHGVLMAICITGCATGPLLEAGLYDVEVTYSVDEWPQSWAGETRAAEWDIRPTGLTSYRLDIYDRIYAGEAVNRHIVFLGTQEFGCGGSELKLDIIAFGDNFTGASTIEVDLCEGFTRRTEVTVVGRLR